jgi:hypothetical protein
MIGRQQHMAARACAERCATEQLREQDRVTENYLLASSAVAAALLIVIALGVTRRWTGPQDKSAALEKLRRSGRYWGVKIRPGRCDAVRPLADRRFTFQEAPTLPLAGCGARRCTCGYIGVPEHRREHRRMRHDRRAAVRFDEDRGGRRSIHGRRHHDKAWNNPAD